MIKVNEYFDGKVKSLALDHNGDQSTIGVMKAGTYEFGTSTVEFMTVTSGIMEVMLPGDSEWKSYTPFETFRVEKDVKFRVRVAADTSYLCRYE
jgi:purine/pyrimidine-nucleoside phosphorylase